MPQLDIAIFFNQFFWFFGFFICLYYFFPYVIIPKVNFYYFIRYNITQVVREFDNLVVLPDVSMQIFSQNSNEFDVIHSNVCSYLYSNFRFPILPTTSTEVGFAPLAEINVLVLDFFLSETLNGGGSSIELLIMRANTF